MAMTEKQVDKRAAEAQLTSSCMHSEPEHQALPHGCLGTIESNALGSPVVVPLGAPFQLFREPSLTPKSRRRS